VKLTPATRSRFNGEIDVASLDPRDADRGVPRVRGCFANLHADGEGRESNMRLLFPLTVTVPMVLACGSTAPSSAQGSGASCYTLSVPPTTFDPNGTAECEFLITVSGPPQCETMNGIVANQAGSCPASGLLGCCVTNIGNEGALAGTLAGVCYYDASFASEGKSGCNGANSTWQTTAP
jgi:hypothetical protein